MKKILQAFFSAVLALGMCFMLFGCDGQGSNLPPQQQTPEPSEPSEPSGPIVDETVHATEEELVGILIASNAERLSLSGEYVHTEYSLVDSSVMTADLAGAIDFSEGKTEADLCAILFEEGEHSVEYAFLRRNALYSGELAKDAFPDSLLEAAESKDFCAMTEYLHTDAVVLRESEMQFFPVPQNPASLTGLFSHVGGTVEERTDGVSLTYDLFDLFELSVQTAYMVLCGVTSETTVSDLLSDPATDALLTELFDGVAAEDAARLFGEEISDLLPPMGDSGLYPYLKSCLNSKAVFNAVFAGTAAPEGAETLAELSVGDLLTVLGVEDPEETLSRTKISLWSLIQMLPQLRERTEAELTFLFDARKEYIGADLLLCADSVGESLSCSLSLRVEEGSCLTDLTGVRYLEDRFTVESEGVYERELTITAHYEDDSSEIYAMPVVMTLKDGSIFVEYGEEGGFYGSFTERVFPDDKIHTLEFSEPKSITMDSGREIQIGQIAYRYDASDTPNTYEFAMEFVVTDGCTRSDCGMEALPIVCERLVGTL